MVLISEFWNMGGYAFYIWPAYGVSLVALLALGFLSFRKKKTLEARLDDLKIGKKK